MSRHLKVELSRVELTSRSWCTVEKSRVLTKDSGQERVVCVPGRELLMP